MPASPANEMSGRVASLHLHSGDPGVPLVARDSIEVIAQQGIAGEPRYFGRVSRATGQPSRRQVSLIEREQIAAHTATLGLHTIPPGAVRSNIETTGIDLVPLIGRRIQIGDAILALYEARTPCAKMDLVCNGLRSLMEDGRQGVLAEVTQSGRIRVNDTIRVLNTPDATHGPHPRP